MSRGQGQVAPDLQIHYRDDRGRRRRVRVWCDADRGYRGDFRAFAEVGGRRDALVPIGEHWATGDAVVAQELAQRRLEDLQAKRMARRAGRLADDPRLADYAERHLVAKAGRRVKASTLEHDRYAFVHVERLLGADVRLSDLTVARLRDYVQRRRRERSQSDRLIADRTILNELHSVSNLWEYAKADELVAGENPVPAVKQLERVEPAPTEAVWLESGEAARLLAAAHTLDAGAATTTRCPCFEAIVGACLLMGGRIGEVLGLERGDVDLEGGWIHVRPNRWRDGLKSRHARRAVPLWPQLREILAAHLGRLHAGVLLFPSHAARVQGREAPYEALNEGLAAVVAAAKLDKHVTWHTLRHTYAAHRLYTTDGGAPVSPWTVVTELGHRDLGMLERVYGHVLRDRERRGTRAAEVRYEIASVLPFARKAEGA